MCAGEHTCVCTQRPEVNIECLSQQLFTLTFWYTLLLTLELATQRDWLESKLRHHLYLLPPWSLVRGFRYMPQCSTFLKNIGNPDSLHVYPSSTLSAALSLQFLDFFLFVFFSQSYSFVVQTRLKRTLNSLIFLPLFPKVLAWWVCVTMQCWKCKSVPCAC